MAHRSTNLGRRGRKKRKETLRLKKLMEARQKAERAERERRAYLLKAILPWVQPMCSLGEDGIIVEKHVVGRYPRQMWFSQYCVDGCVRGSTIGVNEVEIKEVEPWLEIPSDRLQRLIKKDWHPFRTKTLLQRLADL